MGLLAWLIPVALVFGIYHVPAHYLTPEKALTYLVVLVVFVAATRRPDLSLLGLILFLPFQGLVLAKLWSSGVPVSIVRHLGAWKETLALGVVIAGARQSLASGRRLDLVDRLGLGFVAICAIYLVFQTKLTTFAPSAMSIRLLGFREMAGFVLLLVGARHAPLPPGFLKRASGALLISSTVVAGVGIFEAVSSSSWNRFVIHTIKYTQYQVAVLGTHPPNLNDIRSFGGGLAGSSIVRVGSVFLSPLSCGFYLIMGFAAALERAVARRWSLWSLLVTTAIGAALLLTQTRSAILGGLIVLALAFWPALSRLRHWRLQASILLTGLVLLAVPTAIATGVVSRLKLTADTGNGDTSGHISSFWSALHVIEANPVGLGLGTSAGTGQRFAAQVKGVVIPENSYLEVGAELGFLPMGLFIALMVALVIRLRRSARSYGSPLLTAMWAAAWGLAVGSWFLQTWADFPTAWTFWGLAGAVVGVADRSSIIHRNPTRAEVPATWDRTLAIEPGERGSARRDEVPLPGAAAWIAKARP